MTKRVINLCSLFVIIVFVSGCGNSNSNSIDSSSSSSTETVPVTSTHKEVKSEIIEQQSANDFSIFMDEKYLTLKDFDKDNYITNVLGKPIKESLELLGKGADTYEGSSIKTLEYKGLTIKLFSGQDYYWITRIEIVDKKYKTFRGLTVGMSLNDLKSKYKNITLALDGRTDVNNCGYTFNDGVQFMWFEVKSGIIKKIKYYLELG